MDVSKNVNSVGSGADYSYSGSTWSSTGYFVPGLYSDSEVYQPLGQIATYANESNLIFFKHKGTSLFNFKKSGGTATDIEVVVWHQANGVGGATTILSRFTLNVVNSVAFNYSFFVKNLAAGVVRVYITPVSGTLTLNTGTITSERVTL